MPPIEIWDGARNAARALEQHPRHYNRLGMRGIEDALVMLTLNNDGVRQFAAAAPMNTDEHNRLAFFSRNAGDGLTADDMQEIFDSIDPLTNPQSGFHRQFADDLDLEYIAERLLMGDFIQRAYDMAQAVAAEDRKAVIEAMGLDNGGNVEGASERYKQALALNPGNNAAKYGLLMLHLGDIARGQVPREIISLANSLRGPERRVFEAWTYGLRGQFGRIGELDYILARVPPNLAGISHRGQTAGGLARGAGARGRGYAGRAGRAGNAGQPAGDLLESGPLYPPFRLCLLCR